MSTPRQTQLWMYERMIRSRYMEEQLIPVYFQDKLPAFDMRKGPLPGEMHWSFGQEPVGAGVCACLGPDDVLTTAHRPHHIAIARDVNLKKLVAELLQRKSGLSEGRGGHMHLYDASVNFSCSSIVGESVAPTAGMAWAKKLRGEPGVAVTVIGEGAVNQGSWHEAMNMAVLWKVPFICVIEDNYYGVTVAKHESTSIARNSDRAPAYGCAGEYVEGNDADAIAEAMGRAVDRAKAGEGPTILEIQTARLMGHFAGDQGVYIPEQIKNEYFVDALPAYRERLLAGGSSEADIAALEESVKAEVKDAIDWALNEDHIEPEAALEKVFA